MHSKLTAVDHTYILSYKQFLTYGTFLNSQMHLESKRNVQATQQGRKRVLELEIA